MSKPDGMFDAVKPLKRTVVFTPDKKRGGWSFTLTVISISHGPYDDKDQALDDSDPALNGLEMSPEEKTKTREQLENQIETAFSTDT